MMYKANTFYKVDSPWGASIFIVKTAGSKILSIFMSPDKGCAFYEDGESAFMKALEEHDGMESPKFIGIEAQRLTMGFILSIPFKKQAGAITPEAFLKDW
jgi:hypothetical protein